MIAQAHALTCNTTANQTLSEDISTTFTISIQLASGENSPKISITKAPVNGALTAGTASVIGSTYSQPHTYKPNANFNGSDSFSWQGVAQSGLVIKTCPGFLTSNAVGLTIKAVNDKPTASAVTGTTDEDVTFSPVLLGADVDGDKLTYELSSTTTFSITPSTTVTNTYGTLSYNVTTGTATYMPAKNFNGIAKYYYRAKDTALSSTAALITIAVNKTNDAPLSGTTDPVTTNEDVPVPLTMSATDADGDTLTYKVTFAGQGTVGAVSGNQVTFTPKQNLFGDTTLEFTATDPSGAWSPGKIPVKVTPVNDAPTFTTLPAVTLDEDTSVIITMKAFDPDGDPLKYAPAMPANGSIEPVTGTENKVTFTPDRNFNGPSALDFTASDPAGLTVSGKIDISVTPVADEVKANPVTASTDEDKAVTITLLSNGDGTLSYKVDDPVHGSVSTPSADQVTYTPDLNFNGTETFDYTVSDGVTSSTATVTVTVNAVNDPPVANDFSATLTATKFEKGSVALNPAVTDPDTGDVITLAYAFTSSTPGFVTKKGGTDHYVDLNGFEAADAYTTSFKYTATDQTGASSTANINVSAVLENRKPVATSYKRKVKKNGSVTITLQAADPEKTSVTYGPGAVFAANGAVKYEGNEATYEPSTDFIGSDTFTFSATDADGKSSEGTVGIVVLADNAAPTAKDVTATTSEDSAVTIDLSGEDGDGDALSFWVKDDGDHGTAEVAGAKLTYTPDAGFDGVTTLKYVAYDGDKESEEATVTVTVNGTDNDKPTADELHLYTKEDNAIEYDLSGEDPEGDALTFSIGTGASKGTATISGSKLTYEPHADAYGADSFTYKVSDGGSSSDEIAVTVTISSVPDPRSSCDTTISSDHLQTDSGSGVQYYDNIVAVTFDKPATAAQKDDIATTTGASRIACSTELDELKEDETYGAIDATDTGFGIYYLEVPQGSLEELNGIVVALEAKGYSAFVPLLGMSQADGAETDAERFATSSLEDPITKYFQLPQVQGANEYLKAYALQGGILNRVKVGVMDTGICADPTGRCASKFPIPEDFSHVKTASDDGWGVVDADFHGTGYRAALDDQNLHGTCVASIIGSLSNEVTLGGAAFTECGYDIVNNYYPQNGILGGVDGLNFELYAFLSDAANSFSHYTWSSIYPNGQDRVFAQLCSAVDVSNHSYGLAYDSLYDTSGNWNPGPGLCFGISNSECYQKYLRAQQQDFLLMANCPGNLFFLSGGNASIDFDSPTNSGEEAYATLRAANRSFLTKDAVGKWTNASSLTNVLAVQATLIDDADTKSVISNSGGYVKKGMAANGESTSFSTPIVTGTAALMLSVLPSSAPQDIINGLRAVGRKTDDTGTPFVDTAASVLYAIDKTGRNFVPFNATRVEYCAGEWNETEGDCDPMDLGELRAEDGYLTGERTEDGYWQDEGNGRIRVHRQGTDKSTDPGIVHDMSGGALREMRVLEVELQNESDEYFDMGLDLFADPNDGTRAVPALTMLPKGTHTQAVKGRFNAFEFNEALDSFDNTAHIDVSGAYCFKSDLKINVAADPSAAFRIPLARESGLGDHTVKYVIGEGSKITGNYALKSRDSESSGSSATYASLQPDCDGDVVLDSGLSDTVADYDAWTEDLAEIEVADEVCYYCRPGSEELCFSSNASKVGSWAWITDDGTNDFDLCDIDTDANGNAATKNTRCLGDQWIPTNCGLEYAEGRCGFTGSSDGYGTTSDYCLPAEEFWIGTSGSVSGKNLSPETRASTRGIDTDKPTQLVCGTERGSADGGNHEDAEGDYFEHFEIVLKETTCEFTATPRHGYLAYPHQGVKTSVNGGDPQYLQSFALDMDTPSAPCSIMADVTYSYVINSLNFGHVSKYDGRDDSTCDGNMYRTEVFTETIDDVPLTLTFRDGGFVVDKEELSELFAGSLALQLYHGDSWSSDFHSMASWAMPTEFQTPGIGPDMAPVKWVHGLGPLAPYEGGHDEIAAPSTVKKFHVKKVKKPDRSVP